MALTHWNEDHSQETSRYQKGDTTGASQSWTQCRSGAI